MKKFLLSLVLLIAIFVGAVLGLNNYFKGKIASFLSYSIADNIALEYDAITVDSWEGTVKLKDVFLKINKKNDTLVNTRINTGEISFSGLSYWDYFVHNRVHFKLIKVDHNSIWFLDDTSKKELKSKTGPLRLGKEIQIDKLEIGETSLKMLKPEKDSLFLEIAKVSFSLEDIITNKALITRKIPLSYGNMLLMADSIFVKLNPYDNLEIGSLVLEREDILLKKASIKTKFGKNELSRYITKERDYIDLQIAELSIQKIAWGFNDGLLFAKAGALRLAQPQLEIYRDKLVADDATSKPLYSKLLREVPFDLMLDSLLITDAGIRYNEKVKNDQPAGMINFTDLNIKAAHLGNTYKLGEQKTTLAITGTFLDTAPISIDWSFDVQDDTDRFNLNGFMGYMPAKNINTFTEPNLRAKMTGTVDRVYFNINGNDDASAIDMRMKYENFKIAILNKESKKNKFFSAIANLFVSNNSQKTDGDDYRAGRGDAERDKTKSFFNYLWLNLKSGLVEVLLGNGKK